MKTYRIEIPSGETAVTAATWDTSCALVPQDFTHTDDSGFQEIVTDGHWAFDNNIIRFTASTNTTDSVREGYMTITYKVNGASCEKRTHLVQAAGSGSTPSYDFKLAIDVPQGKTSPVIQFYTANGTYMGGYGRVSTDSEVELTWQGSGTITKMTFAENGSYLSAVTVHGHAGITLINNQPLNSGSVTTIDLLQNINTADYSDGIKTIYVSFSE